MRDRLLRLGVPFFAFTFFLWPLLMYALYHPLGAAPGSYWDEFLSDEGYIDTGPFWFVGVLLIFSLAYAAVSHIRQRSAPHLAKPPRSRRPELGQLLLLAAGVAVASFLVRLAYPFGTETVTDLNPWEWPACLALFGLGIAASGGGWLTEIPESLRRSCRNLTLLAVIAAAGLLFAAYRGAVLQDMLGGWNLPAFAFAGVESILSIFGSVWILGAAQQKLRGFIRRGAAFRRSSYAAFLVQGPVLIGIALVLRPLEVAAEVKAVMVAAGGVAGSFALAWLLISRVPALARIL